MCGAGPLNGEIAAASNQLAADSAAWPEPGRPDHDSASACRTERLLGVILAAACAAPLAAGVPLVTAQSVGRRGLGVIFLSDALGVAFTCAGLALLWLQRRRLARLKLGERRWAAVVGPSPWLGGWFWSTVLTLSAFFGLVWWFRAGTRGAAALPEAAALVSFQLILSVGWTRLARRPGRFRAGWAGLLAALLLAGSLMVVGAVFASPALFGAINAVSASTVAYFGVVCTLAAACGWALALSPVPIGPDSGPLEGFPVSVFSSALSQRAVGRALFRNGLFRCGLVGLLAFAGAVVLWALVAWTSGLLALTLQAAMAVVSLGVLTWAAVVCRLTLWPLVHSGPADCDSADIHKK